MTIETIPALAVLLALVSTHPAVAAEAPEGLRLEAVAEKTVVDVGQPLVVAVRLVNGSKSATHPVVRSNDGSESGWREPHVFWSAVRVAPDGTETPLEALGIGRCGLFAADWKKDVMRLGPGESMAVEWMLPISNCFDLQAEGHVRIVAHYAWRGGIGKGLPPKPAEEAARPDPGEDMKGVAPYELRSNPVDIRIRRPLDVVAEATAAAKAGVDTRLSDLVRIRLANRSGKSLEYVPAAARLDFICYPQGGAPYPEVAPRAPSRAAAQRTIAPDEIATIVSTETADSAPDLSLRFAAPGVYRLAIGVSLDGGAGVRSNWVEVIVN